VGEIEFSDAIDHEDDDCKLDIFQTIASNNEPVKELMIKKLLHSSRFHIDVKDIKSPLLWWEKQHSRFPIVGLLARQILGIVRSQVEMKRIFYLGGILTNLRTCHLQSENLEKLNIFVSKNWLNDLIVGCKKTFTLVEFIKKEENSEEELEELEEECEREKIGNCTFFADFIYKKYH
jgi:hypothetical protein